jgi:phosphatidylserine decarboxylase
MWVWRSIFICGASVSDAIFFEPAFHRNALQVAHWRRFFDFFTAFLAGTARVILPELEHRLTEVLNDIGAIEMDIFD